MMHRSDLGAETPLGLPIGPDQSRVDAAYEILAITGVLQGEVLDAMDGEQHLAAGVALTMAFFARERRLLNGSAPADDDHLAVFDRARSFWAETDEVDLRARVLDLGARIVRLIEGQGPDEVTELQRAVYVVLSGGDAESDAESDADLDAETGSDDVDLEDADSTVVVGSIANPVAEKLGSSSEHGRTTTTTTLSFGRRRGDESDSLKEYLKEIGRVPLLNAEQEVDLAKRIEAGLLSEFKLAKAGFLFSPDGRSEFEWVADEGLVESPGNLPDDYRLELEWIAGDGRRARGHLLEANLRLVVSVAKKYPTERMSLLDIIQEANLGLIRAVEKFDFTRGYKFSTYAMGWIRQAIQRGMADQARTIRIPVHMAESINELVRAEREMHQKLGREPTPEELAVEIDMTPDRIMEIQKYGREPVSIHTKIGDEDAELGDFIEDGDAERPGERLTSHMLADQLDHQLDSLTPREATIMRMRFGLYDGDPHTLDEIGKMLGLTRERIRQLEKQSLSKLRHPSLARPLLDYYE